MDARLKRRIGRLEDRSAAGSGKPRRVERIVVRRLDRHLSLENAECSRMLYPNGTLIEMVRLENSREGREELTKDALDRFVESFPVKVLV